MATLRDRVVGAWNAFKYEEERVYSNNYTPQVYSSGFSGYHQRPKLTLNSEKHIISSIYTRLAIDLMMLDFKHVRVDDNGRYLETINSSLNERLTRSANLDQSHRDIFLDIGFTLFDKATAVLIPVETSKNINDFGSFDIYEFRVGEVVPGGWSANQVKVSVYNKFKNERQEVTVDKAAVAIFNNPFYSVMNQPNSTLKRLVHKLSLLDKTDEAVSSGKLDLIIKLPYVIKSDARREQAYARRQDIEAQLRGSQYGIAYIDGTETITQLNRPVENNLWNQITDLKNDVYSELGLTPEIMNGTADQQTMLNYQNRTIVPIADVLRFEMERKLLTKTAYAQNQRIMYFRDPFAIVPIEQLAEIADKFTRNEILSANEIRGLVGIKPSGDPKADELRNSNIRRPDEKEEPTAQPELEEERNQNGS